MVQLTTNLSAPLLALWLEGQAPIDGVELGPWFSMRQVRAYREALSDLPFTFHGGDLIERVGLIPGSVARIKGYLRAARSPWASMHMTMWLPGQVWLMFRRGWRMRLPDPERATRRHIWQVRRLAGAVPVPVLLENMPCLAEPGYEFEVQPARITQVLDATGCGLVLDTGHARLAARALGIGAEEYVAALPLERVVQVHASGPRERDGRLVDAHEPLQEVDYALLAFVLARTRPKMLTLEYIREKEALREQLAHLRGMLGR